MLLKGNRTLSISNISNGSTGKIIVQQDSTGHRKLTLPANSYISEEGNGAPALTQVAGGIDELSFVYNGTNYYWMLHKSYTVSPRVARFNFNETPQNVQGWNDVSGFPHQAVRTAKDVATGIGVSSIATTKRGAFGSGTASNTMGENDANPTFIFDPQVTRSYCFRQPILIPPAQIATWRLTDCNQGQHITSKFFLPAKLQTLHNLIVTCVPFV